MPALFETGGGWRPVNQIVSLYKNHRSEAHKKKFKNPRICKNNQINQIAYKN